MTSLDYAIVNEGYFVHCHQCDQQFNALVATWCHCGGKLRTLTCPHCQTCFCRAPVQYRTRFWEEAPRDLRESTERFHIGDGLRVPAVQTGSAAAGASSPPRVLIVDDEEDMRSLVACYVEQMGYDVTSVSGPKDALTALESAPFEVVLTDALMPGMDGRELCRQLKDTYGDAIKVIVMTSLYTASRYKTEARYRFGVDDYLAKPLHFSALKTALERVAPLGTHAG